MRAKLLALRTRMQGANGNARPMTTQGQAEKLSRPIFPFLRVKYSTFSFMGKLRSAAYPVRSALPQRHSKEAGTACSTPGAAGAAVAAALAAWDASDGTSG